VAFEPSVSPPLSLVLTNVLRMSYIFDPSKLLNYKQCPGLLKETGINTNCRS
jgi:hypothetical protein